MKFHRMTIASLLVIVAALLWIGVVSFARAIHAAEETSALRVSTTELAAAQESSALRLRALARDTKDLRDELQRLTSDVLSAADMIDSVGTVSGAEIEIGSAVPDGLSPEGADRDEKAVNFLVEGIGTWDEIMKALSLFETLPLISKVESVQFERMASGQLWSLVIRIQVLTNADEQL